MKRALTLLLMSIFFAGALGACGGTPRSSETANRDDEEDEDDYIDEEPEEDDEDGDGFIDQALLRQSAEPLVLGEAMAVPGTGVSVRAPSGSRLLPFGGGFLAVQQRVQISVVVAVGDEDVLETIRTGGSEDAPEPEHQEDVTIAGQRGRIGRDRVRAQGGTLERNWLLVHDGTRGLGIIATCEADRARVYRAGLQEMLSTVEWDRETALDPSVALGIQVDPVEGLEMSTRSTANLVLLAPGAPFPPEAGHAVITVSPLPMQVPTDRLRTICSQLAARLVPVPDDDIEHEGVIEDGQLPGCERLATADTRDGDRVITYAALVFNEGLPILLTASGPADEMTTWRPRFATAARSVRVRPPE